LERPNQTSQKSRKPGPGSNASCSTLRKTKDKHIEHWLCVLRGAERQLDAAKLGSDMDYAARPASEDQTVALGEVLEARHR
jgi:hypothetical protein